MTLILLVILLVLLLGTGGYWARNGFGDPGIPAMLGLICVVVLIFWLLGTFFYDFGPTPPLH
jgi:hypothetical protein